MTSRPDKSFYYSLTTLNQAYKSSLYVYYTDKLAVSTHFKGETTTKLKISYFSMGVIFKKMEQSFFEGMISSCKEKSSDESTVVNHL